MRISSLEQPAEERVPAPLSSRRLALSWIVSWEDLAAELVIALAVPVTAIRASFAPRATEPTISSQKWMSDVRKQLSAVEPYRCFEASTHSESESAGTTLLGRSGWLNFLYAHLSGFSHGRPFYLGESGNRLPSSNVELWGGSNGPVYEPRSVRLWSRFYFDVALISLLLVGLAARRLLAIRRPADIHYLEYLKRLLAWHFGPPPVAQYIVSYLTS